MIPRDVFDRMSSGVRMSRQIRRAARSVMVDGVKWVDAARRHGVTESGISKAIKRMTRQQANCTLCGQPMPNGIHEA